MNPKLATRNMKYFLLNKPYGVLSQFTKEIPSHQTLGDCFDFPSDVYSVGRLDRDSEGLLILTNDNRLKHRLLDPTFRHQRTYLVQVENIPTDEAIDSLKKGVTIRINKKNYTTLPAKAALLQEAPPLPTRNPPIRKRKNIPTAWIQLSLTEGKNRQVRRMCAAVGFPVLRLVRIGIEGLTLGSLKMGEVKELSKTKIYSLLERQLKK